MRLKELISEQGRVPATQGTLIAALVSRYALLFSVVIGVVVHPEEKSVTGRWLFGLVFVSVGAFILCEMFWRTFQTQRDIRFRAQPPIRPDESPIKYRVILTIFLLVSLGFIGMGIVYIAKAVL